MQPEEMAALIESLGPLHLRPDGVALVHRDGGVFRLDGPTVRRFVAEEVWRPMPARAVGKAIEMLADRALDVRSPPTDAD